MGTHGRPECRGSYDRVKLRTKEQVYRERECFVCGKTLRVRLSERTGEATLPRHRVDKREPELGPTDTVKGPPCRVCRGDLWVVTKGGTLACLGHDPKTGGDCVETRELPQ